MNVPKNEHFLAQGIATRAIMIVFMDGYISYSTVFINLRSILRGVKQILERFSYHLKKGSLTSE